MKRTRETISREHPQWQQREGISGLTEFDGEDIEFDSRTKQDKEIQKHWVHQQMHEKKQKAADDKAEERAYATQTLELNRFRGMLQDTFHQRKTEIGVAAKQTNLQLVFHIIAIQKAKEKKDKEAEERKNKLQYEREEVLLLQQRGRRQVNG